MRILQHLRLASPVVLQERGNALIEVSLILPILIVMLLATLDVGLILQQYMTVVESSRVGAVYSTRWPFASDTAGMQNAATATASGVPNYTAAAAIVCTCGPGGGAASCTGGCSGGTSLIQYAQLTASANLSLPFTVAGLPQHVTVRSVARMRVPR